MRKQPLWALQWGRDPKVAEGAVAPNRCAEAVGKRSFERFPTHGIIRVRGGESSRDKWVRKPKLRGSSANGVFAITGALEGLLVKDPWARRALARCRAGPNYTITARSGGGGEP